MFNFGKVVISCKVNLRNYFVDRMWTMDAQTSPQLEPQSTSVWDPQDPHHQVDAAGFARRSKT